MEPQAEEGSSTRSRTSRIASAIIVKNVITEGANTTKKSNATKEEDKYATAAATATSSAAAATIATSHESTKRGEGKAGTKTQVGGGPEVRGRGWNTARAVQDNNHVRGGDRINGKREQQRQNQIQIWGRVRGGRIHQQHPNKTCSSSSPVQGRAAKFHRQPK
jgi:hypothetical protein